MKSKSANDATAEIHYARYSARATFPCPNVLALSGASRQEAKAVIPVLRETSDMERRSAPTSEIRAMNGELADEVHDFDTARLGMMELKSIWLRSGRVINMTLS
jgi:hypothetical protein